MKYLIIVVLVSIIFVLVYSRVRPYLKLIQKVMQSFNVVTDINTTTATQQKTPSGNKLVRCDSCGTWIPAERALSLNSGLATYCSTECMAKKPASKRKLAG
jgi:predicted SprT family Zn-dependent metalloprotease